MAEHLFPKFLTDAREYERAEALWQRQWEEVVRRAGEQELWESPWLRATLADGTACRDGNPIFSAVCPSRRLGVRLIQLEPSGEPRELYYWTATFAKGEPEEVTELVISCVLTRETLLDAVGLMDQWVTRGEVQVLQHD